MILRAGTITQSQIAKLWVVWQKVHMAFSTYTLMNMSFSEKMLAIKPHAAADYQTVRPKVVSSNKGLMAPSASTYGKLNGY